ncbi:uncharacterized protein [Aegilops tauschii subsp. strangulata]|uniref:uncharacterized protein isoform X2 n=1 Tax=Aegilops tauschii subsp. strangulata TaxID=200361 RepID=UPI00098A1DF4|nr:uncharacterized protein LOC109780424 isoform X2 [Aegilops tauschii subsp. strangulata]
MNYTTRTIAFNGLFPTIVCQKDNNSSPLLALCNSLILLGEFNLNLGYGVCTISEKKLIDRVSDYFMTKATHKGTKTRRTANKTLKRLAQPIQCKMMLTSVEHMETSEELQLFEKLGIKVYHANVVDPKEEELVRAIGTNTFDTLLAGLAAHKAKTDVQSRSPGSSKVDGSATSHLEAVNWELIDDFLTKNHTQLTAYGIQSIKQQMIDNNTTVCALFWNNQFHVVSQLHGTLLLLQNNADQVDKPIVWKHFNDVLDSSWTQGNDYVAKSVDFKGCRRFIIYPNMTGSSALVALCNAILLRGDVDLSKILDCNLSLNLGHLHQVVFGASKTKSYTMRPEEWVVAVGCLHQPVDVKMNFKSIRNIKITKDFEIFENFGFDLYHGFIADPEDLNLCNAIGERYYDCTTESPPSHLKVEDHRELLDKFLKDHDTELTPHGLQSLQEELSETNIHVIFWNKQFHTAIKCNNRIFVLDPSLSSFDAGKIWRSLDSVDGAGETLASVSYPKSGEHKCISPDCLLAFNSPFNLRRHNYVHHTSSGSKELDILQHRTEFSNCWDSLSSEESGEILSLKDMKFKKLEGKLIVRILEQRSSEGDSVAMTLLGIRSRLMEGEKITSAVLFAVLDEASEKTLLSSDIRNCEEGRIWDGSPSGIMTDMNSLLACYSYLLEKALVNKWLQHKDALANKVGEDLIAAEKAEKRGKKKANDQNKQGNHSSTRNHSSTSTGQRDDQSLEGTGEDTRDNDKQGELDISSHPTGNHSSTSTGQRDDQPLEGTAEDPRDNRVQSSQSLKHPEDDTIGNLYDLVLEFLKRFRNNEPKKFYRGIIEAIKYMNNLHMHILFSHIEEYSPELAAYIIDHYHDSDRVKADISRAAAQYLIEHNIGKSEQEIREGISVMIVGLPSPTSNMSFKKYARLNKLIRPFKLPKKFRRLFSPRWKGRLYLMTYAGRKAARGLLNYILETHKEKLCWRGEWKLSDMRIKDGLFRIDKQALYDADVDGMAEDFKKYIELLNPYYVVVEQSSSNSPPYWEILQTDTMVIPDPSKDPKAFRRFL